MKSWVFACILIPITLFSQETGRWGDQGEETFRNPIIAGDYSDPDPIRVGEEYFMAVSTFESSPGVSILHSNDLVNWEYSGSVFTDLTVVDPAFRWNRMERYGEGVFAPSLRYHEGKFWVFVIFLTDGFYMATSNHPSETWEIHQIKDRNGRPLRTRWWTDPCPFWDEDGKAYLASSRPGDAWYGYLFEMTPDGKQLLDADVDHMNIEGIEYKYPLGGTQYSPFQSTEGHKIYKRNGYYYLIHITDGKGEMKWELPKPIEGFPMVYPFISDYFDDPELNPVWQWNHQPDNSKLSLSDHKGYLRMYASKAKHFFKAPNTINQRHFKSDSTIVTVKILINGMDEGQQAGLAHFTGGTSYASLGVEIANGNKSLVYDTYGKKIRIIKIEADQEILYLRTRIMMDNPVTWSYSFDAKTFLEVKKTYDIQSGNYRGNMVGIFNYNSESASGYIDVDWFKYIVNNK